MENNKIKNTIVLRGMASNVVDEAIVILKPNIKIKKTQTVKSIREKGNSKELILKEAEHIVETYVNQISEEQLKKEKQKLKKKIFKLRLITISIFVLLIITIMIR